MELVLHIIIALTGLIISFISVLSPKSSLINLSYVCIFLTFATGTLLVFQHPSHLPHACISGLLYITASLALTTYARHRLTQSI